MRLALPLIQLRAIETIPVSAPPEAISLTRRQPSKFGSTGFALFGAVFGFGRTPATPSNCTKSFWSSEVTAASVSSDTAKSSTWTSSSFARFETILDFLHKRSQSKP